MRRRWDDLHRRHRYDEQPRGLPVGLGLAALLVIALGFTLAGVRPDARAFHNSEIRTAPRYTLPDGRPYLQVEVTAMTFRETGRALAFDEPVRVYVRESDLIGARR